MEYKYGDIVKIVRRDEYGSISNNHYRVVDKAIDGGSDIYLLQDVDGKTLRGWHKANKLVKVEVKQ